MSEYDVNWSPDRRESWDDVGARVQAFLSWLCQRKEENIVVVGHGIWIEACLSIFSPGALQGRRVNNCDAYAAKFLSNQGRILGLSDVKLI